MVMEINLSGSQFIAAVTSREDIAERVRENHIESLTGSAGDLIFWFTPRDLYAVNRAATQILWAYTDFDARSVPLLRGNVVVTGRDRESGEPIALSAAQRDEIWAVGPTGRQRRILGRRCVRASRRQRREAKARTARSASTI